MWTERTGIEYAYTWYTQKIQVKIYGLNSCSTRCTGVEGPSTVNVHRISSPLWSSGDRLHLLVTSAVSLLLHLAVQNSCRREL